MHELVLRSILCICWTFQGFCFTIFSSASLIPGAGQLKAIELAVFLVNGQPAAVLNCLEEHV